MKMFKLMWVILTFILWKENVFCFQERLEIRELDEKYGQALQILAIFRHGERAPIFDSYPRDPYRTYHWPNGRGQLLQVGKRKMYQLGIWYRNRYKNLVKLITSHTNISVVSSNLDRTIMSAECFMAAFYYPCKNERLAKNLPWQPLPLRVNSFPFDVLSYIDTRCPAKDEIWKMFLENEVKLILDRYHQLFRVLQKHSGFKFYTNNIFDSIWKSVFVWDNLIVQKSIGFKVPNWTHEIFPESLANVSTEFHVAKIRPLKIKKLLAECTVNLIFEQHQALEVLPNLFHCFAIWGVCVDLFLTGVIVIWHKFVQK